MDAQKDSTAAQVQVDADGIPINTGDSVSECCWVGPGQPHTLSCENVSPAQAFAVINRR